ncbi:alanine racemase [Altererythrobacter sp. B11]|uniref:alanine racemase n=1 Tax=Altererythrobacter sp. B11 TaxID=2060312 RepID=UPI000E5B133E|nr:alanine racemase [Altererythrobacter sp. B11]
MPPEPPPPALRLTVDTEALAENWRLLDQLSGSAAAGAAVKANAYGLGADVVVPALVKAGARDFFVAHWNEVATVLRHVAPDRLSVLHGPVRAEEAAFARAAGVRPVINSLQQAQLWIEAGGGPCDLMVDTGMNRLGISMHEIGDPLLGRLETHTLLSHLASADEDVPQSELQLERFREVTRMLPARRRSLANSAGIALGSDYAFDLTRPGLALYGGVPRRELAGRIRQVARPQALVLQLREIAAGQSVGYNARFTSTSPMRLATVALGYADGFLRCWNGKAALRHGSAELPLLGNISMDLSVLDCGAAPDLREGDWVDIPYDLPVSSALTGLTQYELLTILGTRFCRAA